MPDWKKLVEEQLGALSLPPESKDDVVAELASHLEDSAPTGNEASKSEHIALGQIQWHKLARAIEHTKRKEDTMNDRLKTLLLPAMGILFTVGVILVLVDRAAVLQRLIWLACMALLLCAAAFGRNQLNQRTKCFWLPGFLGLIQATMFLLAMETIYDPSRFFREITLHPQELLRFNAPSQRTFYLVWLLVQVAFGAVAAYFSQRAGGSRAVRIFAGALPTTVILGTYVLLIPITSRYTTKAATSPLSVYLASALLIWVAAPALALMLGAAPFLGSAKYESVVQG